MVSVSLTVKPSNGSCTNTSNSTTIEPVGTAPTAISAQKHSRLNMSLESVTTIRGQDHSSTLDRERTKKLRHNAFSSIRSVFRFQKSVIRVYYSAYYFVLSYGVKFVSYFFRVDKCMAVVTLRRGVPSSDTIPLIKVLNRSGYNKIKILSIRVSRSPDVENFILEGVDDSGSVEFVYERWRKTFSAVFARRVFWQNDDSISKIVLSGLRRSGEKRGQVIVKLYHGLITKKNSPYKPLFSSGQIKRSAIKAIGPYAHFSVTQGAVESYMRYWKEINDKRAVNEIRALGYPRFFRAMDIISGRETVALPCTIDEQLDQRGSTYRILYAPTRQLHMNNLPGFDKYRLDEFLSANNMTLFVKLHPAVQRKEVSLEYDKLENICFLDEHGITDSLALLSKVEVLITDVSSVAMEAVALRIPVIHINTEKSGYLFERGVALPGTYVDEFQILLSELIAVTEGRKVESLNKVGIFWNINREETIDEAWAGIL